jgi:Na+/phosphate symporter
MVSLLVPLAATGIIGSSHHILPYILGSNVGTVFDVMLAALATGDPAAIGVWLVHFTINIIGALIFLPLSKHFTSFINETNTFFTSSRRRVLIFLGLSNGVPFLILVRGLIA